MSENQKLNLTGARTADEIWSSHVCDSLALLPLIARRGVTRLLDLGSGGGLPGLPLACARPELQVTLLDATRKKSAALQRIIDALGMSNVSAVCGRAETLAHDPAHRERYDAVTVRAVAALNVLVEFASGFVKPGGVCWFFKSVKSAGSEVQAARAAAAQCRLVFAGLHDYPLPGELGNRRIVLYEKQGPLEHHLPRPPTTGAARRPLE